MKSAVLLCVLATTIGCRSLSSQSGSADERDMAAAFEVVLPKLSGGEPLRFVAGSGVTARARRAMGLVRPIAAPGELPGLASTTAAGLPAGYFLVQSFTIVGGVARFEGTAGPVPTMPNLNCGTGYRFELGRVEGGWKIVKWSGFGC
jgi:hypothetical protein